MKKISTFVLLLVSITALSQDSQQALLSTGPVSYYKLLQTFNPVPADTDRALDTLRFAFSDETVRGILALKPWYLEGMTEEAFVIPPPPANSSAQTRAELNFLLNLQHQRSALDVESSKVMAGIYYPVNARPEDAKYELYRRNLFHIGRSIGTWYTPENLPMTADLFANVCKDAHYFIWQLKLKYARIRPYVLESGIENLEETDWAAYPSGHGSNAYISAYILQKLYPAASELFLRDAFEMTRSREILGVHYPSDGEAARLFARQFVDALFRNEAFLSDFAGVEQEWKQRAFERFEKPVHIKAGLPGKTESCANKCKSQ